MSIEKFKKDENIKSNFNKLSSLIEIFSECQELNELYLALSSYEKVEEYFYSPERGVEMKWTPIKESKVFFENMGVKDINKEQFVYEKKSVSMYITLALNIKILVKIKLREDKEKEKIEKNISCFIKIIKEFFLEDIVKEKKHEDEKNRRTHLATIVANEYRYFSLLESLRESVIVAEKRGEMYIIIDMNEACVLYLKKRREEIIGQDMFLLIGIEKDEMKNRFNSKEFYINSKKSWISGTLYYQRENIVNFIFEDITDRKNREIEMKKMFKAIEQSEEIVVIADKNYNIEYVNPKFEKITGYSKEDVHGMKFYFYIRYNKNQESYDFMVDQLEIGNSWSGYTIGEKSTQESFWEYGTVTPIRNETGEVEGYIKVAEDVTVKMEIEGKRAEAEKELEKANRAKSEFLANMSHELRTPMNGIIGSIDLLEDTILDEDQKDTLGIIDYSAKSMLGLINNMLDISELEFGKISIIEKKFDMESFIERASIYMEKMIKQNENLKFKKISEQINCKEYIGDIKRIEQIIMHIFANAMKFTEKGSIIFTVECIEKEKESDFSFIIKDTGVGISEEDISKIFNIFIQIDGTYTRKKGGVGVGLSIAKKLSDLMKGKIDIKSRIKEGSEFIFRVTLPKYINKDIKDKKEIKRIKNILLVEDDFMNRTVMAENLRKMNYIVDIAWNGYEAIEKVKKTVYDIIFMDITMPEMTGYESLKEMRNLGIKTEIVAITGKGLKSERKEGIKLGFNYYIVKPVGRKELYELIACIEKNNK
jgi:PAS domain S-box-containing protein